MMSIRSLADFNGSSPGRCSDWLGTATVTARASTSGTTRRTRDGDFYLATTGDLHLATHGDFLMAMDIRDVGFRLARPVRAADGRLIIDGWVAWQCLEGEHLTRRWAEICTVGERIHRATADIP